MLPKFHVLGDSNANNFFSSSIIVNNLNRAAKNIGLFDENGLKVVYSTTADQMGHNADAILCVYETTFPVPIIRNAGGKPLIGSSLHNLFFITDGGYPNNLSAFCHLGVDTELFQPQNKTHDRFRFLCFAESNARSGLDVLVDAFCRAFSSNKQVELYIKDRGATQIFKMWVQEKAKIANVSIIHDTENTQNFENVKKIYSDSDFMVFVSRSTTWGMTILESMAMGVPVITTSYAGPREITAHNFNCLLADCDVEEIKQERLNYLASIGCRNHMFPPEYCLTPAYWAEPSLSTLMERMYDAFEMPKHKFEKLSKNARITAENFSWEKGAASLSCALRKVKL